VGETRTFNKNTLWALIGLTIVSVAAAAWQGSALGWPAFLFLAGIGLVTLFGVISIVTSNGQNAFDADKSGGANDVLNQSFYALRMPAVIVRNAKPLYTNKAYLQLAASLGTIELEGEPPSVDRLFSKKEKAASAALFRLHHTNFENEKTGIGYARRISGF